MEQVEGGPIRGHVPGVGVTAMDHLDRHRGFVSDILFVLELCVSYKATKNGQNV